MTKYFVLAGISFGIILGFIWGAYETDTHIRGKGSYLPDYKEASCDAACKEWQGKRLSVVGDRCICDNDAVLYADPRNLFQPKRPDVKETP